jgi:hypothetical protein
VTVTGHAGAGAVSRADTRSQTVDPHPRFTVFNGYKTRRRYVLIFVMFRDVSRADRRERSATSSSTTITITTTTTTTTTTRPRQRLGRRTTDIGQRVVHPLSVPQVRVPQTRTRHALRAGVLLQRAQDDNAGARVRPNGPRMHLR